MVREVAFRVLGERPFDVQIMGAMAIADGCVAEMATGEGKTLTATMPAIIAGWRGRGCHIITVNDYLAARDVKWMGRVFEFCGLRAAAVTQGMRPQERREAYLADVTYSTNKEIAADFLRDRLALGNQPRLAARLAAGISDDRPGASPLPSLVQRGLDTAIVDEADSILIDEAVTPLIISSTGENADQESAFVEAARIAASLEPGEDYRVDPRFRDAELTAAGRRRVEKSTANLGGIWAGERRRVELITQAIVAREHYHRDRQYLVQNGRIVIVDEFTGRLMPDRAWRDGMHQAVEAKEGVEVTSPKTTLARISFQRFFRLYRRLSGMTGTAAESAPELARIYRVAVVVIPTSRPVARVQWPDRVFATLDEKWRHVVDEVARVHATGRPVLVGTRSVMASEEVSQRLTSIGLPHEVLNAERHAQEAAIIARAGEAGRITVATNMAGRGTDIKLDALAREFGGLHVIASERHEARRVDRQLFGRSGRQGDPGSAQAIVSLQDELIRRYAPRQGALAARAVNAGSLAARAANRVFRAAERRARAIAYRQRLAVLRADDWLDDALGFAGRAE